MYIGVKGFCPRRSRSRKQHKKNGWKTSQEVSAPETHPRYSVFFKYHVYIFSSLRSPSDPTLLRQRGKAGRLSSPASVKQATHSERKASRREDHISDTRFGVLRVKQLREQTQLGRLLLFSHTTCSTAPFAAAAAAALLRLGAGPLQQRKVSHSSLAPEVSAECAIPGPRLEYIVGFFFPNLVQKMYACVLVLPKRRVPCGGGED